MMADGDIQVWLESDNKKGSLITPFVQSTIARTIQYRLKATKAGSSGRAEVMQSGTVATAIGKPVALARFSMSINPDDVCRIELSLSADGELLATYVLPCP